MQYKPSYLNDEQCTLKEHLTHLSEDPSALKQDLSFSSTSEGVKLFMKWFLEVAQSKTNHTRHEKPCQKIVSSLVFHFILFHLRLERSCSVYFVAFVTNVYQQTVVTMSPKISSLDQKLVLTRKILDGNGLNMRAFLSSNILLETK